MNGNGAQLQHSLLFVIGAARVVGGAGSMHLSGVRPSVCSICCGFAAVGPAAMRRLMHGRWSAAAAPQHGALQQSLISPQNGSKKTEQQQDLTDLTKRNENNYSNSMSLQFVRKCGQCHVVCWRRKVNRLGFFSHSNISFLCSHSYTALSYNGISRGIETRD